jgi:hypothetical protein
MKWFRLFPNVTWLRGDAEAQANVDAVLARWRRAGAV